jgi:hypothetical protein
MFADVFPLEASNLNSDLDSRKDGDGDEDRCQSYGWGALEQ